MTEDFVRVTNAEIWAELRQHARSTGDGGHADHEERIRKLELRYYALLAGLLTGITGVVAMGVIR